MAKASNPDFLNGVPELLILQLLAQRPMHGYDLVEAIRSTSQSRLEFGEGCIYPILHRLEDQKILASRRQLVQGRQRIVYRLTDRGHGRLAESITAWNKVVAGVTAVLQGGANVEPAVA